VAAGYLPLMDRVGPSLTTFHGANKYRSVKAFFSIWELCNGDARPQNGHNKDFAGWAASNPMYQKHFGLTERPFSIAPDPRFLYMSQQHREALAHLLYGVGEAGGFVQLTGEVGTGKTTICRCLLEQLPEHVDLALILNPRVTAQELLASLCDELKIPYARRAASIKALTDALNTYLLESHARGRRTVLMVDEAQNLSADALEQVRLLTNLETTREKLLQIILVGQPELRTLLARDDLRQLSQRITARYHLEPIGRDETAAYIRHRLQVCGAPGQIFTDSAIDLVHKMSYGVPRLINVLCDRAMLGAFVEGKARVEAPIVRKAAAEVLPEEGLDAPAVRSWPWYAAAGLLVAAGLTGYMLIEHYPALAPMPVAGSVRQPDEEIAQPPVVAPPAGAAEEKARVEGAVDVARPAPEERETVASPQAAVDAAPPADLLSAPSDLARALSVAADSDAVSAAWAGLYRLWGVKAEVLGDEQACAQASGVGLSCLQGGGSWAVLSQLDRPAILLLVADDGRRVPVVLQEVQGADARLLVGGERLRVPLAELRERWLGHYRILWKTPPEGSTVLRPGYRGGDVAWLRERLQEATGLAAVAQDPGFYDAGLRELVREFQRAQALDADGIAGPRTLIHLNNSDRSSEGPRLGSING
jgi:general secretion pathway protein A